VKTTLVTKEMNHIFRWSILFYWAPINTQNFP